MRFSVPILSFCLLFCAARGQLISTAEWNANADQIIAGREEKKELVEWLVFLLGYNDHLLKQAGIAERKNDRREQRTLMIVAYFNLKLIRQTLVDNRDKISEFDKIEFECRRLSESVRGSLVRLGYQSTDSLIAFYYREYRKSFEGYPELILRAP